MTTQIKFRVAICGGGIGGLTLAVALSKSPDIEVHIYEAASRFSEVGAGVGMWKRTWNAMEELGLGGDLLMVLARKLSDSPAPVFRFRKSDDQCGGVEFCHLIVPFGQVTFHRAELQKILIKHCASTHTHFRKRLVSYTQPLASSSVPCAYEPIVLCFEDGTTASCDILIGADGIHSPTRACMLNELSARCLKDGGSEDDAQRILSLTDPFWSATVAYRGIFRKDTLESKHPGHRATTGPYMWCGKNGHIVSFLVACGTLINVVAFRSQPEKEGTIYPAAWVAEVTQDELLAQYSGWEPDVLSLLECIDKPSRWAVHAIHPLPSYAFERVALVGDAAHAMTPHQGSGGGQSIEDAYILASLLRHPLTTLSTLSHALRIYDNIRRPLAQMVLENSRANGLIYEFNNEVYDGRPLNTAKDFEDLKSSTTQLWDLWHWAWTGHPHDDGHKAENMLREYIGVGFES